MDKKFSPLLRWAGSKRSSIGALARYFPSPLGTYLEPFCGSASLFFHLTPNRSVLSDLNPALIDFYRALKRNPGEVYDRAVALPRTKNKYYELRDRFNHESDPLWKASLFYYLNKNCFNGLYRTSRVGTFNVPFSKSRTGNYLPRDEFLRAAKLLRRARFECGDFEASVRANCQRGDFVFLDPPYSEARRYPFREYYPGCFSQSDMDRLMDVLAFIEAKEAHFVLTFSSRLKPEVKKGWLLRKIRTRRNIAGFAGARRYVNDIVISNARVEQ
jgi:DNA adenine methylase